MSTILVVDDRSTNRQLLVTLLGYAGHRLLEAANGVEALALVRAEAPDLIITDILMPTMDGFEFVQALRADPALATIKVIFYTATYLVQEADSLAAACGVEHVISKPAEPQQILEIVNAALGVTSVAPSAALPSDPPSTSLNRLTDKLVMALDDLSAVNQQLAALSSTEVEVAAQRGQIAESMQKFSADLASVQTISLRLSLLIELAADLILERNPQRMLDILCHAAGRIVNARHTGIGILAEDGRSLRYFVTHGLDAAATAQIGEPSLDGEILGRLLSERRPLRLHEVVVLHPPLPPINSFLGMPIVTQDHLLGFLYFVDSPNIAGFSTEDEWLATTLAAQIALLYENTQLYDQIQRHAANLQLEVAERQRAEAQIRKLSRTRTVLSDINHAIIRIHPLSALFEEACQIAIDKGNFRMAWIGRYDPLLERVLPVAYAGVVDNYLENLNIDLNDNWQAQGPTASTLRNGEHMVCNDIEHDLRMAPWRADALRLGYRATAAFPLKVAGEVRGTFTLHSDEVGFFDDEEVILLDELAMDISFAIEVAEQDEQRRQAETSVKRYAQRMEILHEIDLGIIRGGSIQALVEETLKSLRQIIPCQRANVTVFDQATNEAIIFAVDLDGETLLGQGVRVPLDPTVFEGLDARHIKVIDDFRPWQESDPRIKQLVNEGLASGLRAIFMDQDRPIGSLGLLSNTPGFFTADYQEIAAEVASQLTIAIRQLNLSDELARYRDHLVQLVDDRTAELLHAKARVEAILNNSTDGIVLATPEGEIEEANHTFNTLFASETGDYFAKPLIDLVEANERERLAALIQAVSTDQISRLSEFQALRKDQKSFAAQIGIGYVHAGDGVSQGLVGSIHDITERKQAEQALQAKMEEERTFQTYLRELHEITIELTQTDQLDEFYRRAVELGLERLGFERMGLLLYDAENSLALGTYGTDANGMLFPEPHIRFDPATYTGILMRAMKRAERFSFDERAPLYSNFEPIGFGWNAAAVLWNGKQSLGWLAADNGVHHRPPSKALLDILALYSMTIGTLLARKQTEIALRESDERMRQIAENIDQVLFIRSGDDQKMLYINSAYEGMTGKSAQNLYANPYSFMDIVLPEDQNHVFQQVMSPHYVETGLSDFEYRILDANSQVHWVRARTFPIQGNDGAILRRAGIIEDITQRKNYEHSLERALEKEKELSELKSRFVSMASHEFRTPLATILATTESLIAYRHRMSEEQVERRFGNIRDQVNHLKNIMEDVLRLARMQAGHVDFQPAPFDLDALFRIIIDELQSQFDRTHVVVYTCERGLPEQTLDKKLMRQLISNLIANAMKYSPAGKTVTVNLTHTSNDIAFSVGDVGIGIPETDLNHLFEAFHRAANVGTISGTGLGLTIVKEAVELHGGTITVESQVDKGTIFTVSIPVTAKGE